MTEKEAIERALEEEDRMVKRQVLLKQLWKIQHRLAEGRGTTGEDSRNVNERRQLLLATQPAESSS